MLAVVDTGPLYAAADAGDLDHTACVDVLSRADIQWVLPSLVIAEAAYLVAARMGPRAEGTFLRGLCGFDVESPTSNDLARMADLVEKYGDFPLGATDAFVVTLAERLGAKVVITLDRRHFAAIRPKHCPVLQILP